MRRTQATLASAGGDGGAPSGRYRGQSVLEADQRQRARPGCSVRFAARYLCLLLMATFLMSLPLARHAIAQTNVAAGSNLSSFSPANGSTLNLLGNVTLSGTLTAPQTLTINGNGNTITVSNGGIGLPQNTTPTLTLGNVTITGTNGTAPVISGSNLQGVNIPITGTVTFLNINTLQSTRSIGVTANGTFSIIGSAGSTVQFINNTEPTGGAISVANAAVAISGDAIFSGNKATTGNGGAISSTGSSAFTIAGPMVNFSGNTAAMSGGAISAQNNSVIIGGNVTLSSNAALGGNGGAVNEASNMVSVGSTGSTVVITGNTATANGGAIYSQNTGVTVNGADVTIQQNTAGGNGGAVDEDSGPVTIGDNSASTTVNITGNTTGSNGGATYANNAATTVNGNATLMNNTALSGSGGAIYDTNNAILISNSGGNVSITGNKAGTNGGAIYEGGGGAVTIGNSGATVDISGNTAGSTGGGSYSQNGLVTVTGSGITLQGNGATTGNGGAVYAGNGFTLNANGPATISGNTAGGLGGAIYLNSGTLSLNATGGDITFSGNTEGSGAANAIYFNAGTANFNAAAGNITFFDPIQSNPNGLVTVTKTGPGMVSFDGSERTNQSNIYANTTVQEGTFEVDNNAVYGATARLSGSFTVNSGATLQGGVAGTVAANQFTLQDGATLNIAGRTQPGAPFSVFTIDANTATFQPGSTISFNTQLNDGLTQNTDLLVLSGAKADAPGGVDVTNVGGAGAYTPADGIRLIEATNGATTVPGNFVLTHEVRAGAFEYMLFRGGKDPADFPNDWFLRNDFTVGAVPAVPLPPGAVAPLGVSPVPVPPGTVPPPVVPVAPLPGTPPAAQLTGEPGGPPVVLTAGTVASEEHAEDAVEDNDIAHEEADGLIPRPVAPGSPDEVFPNDAPPQPLPPGVYPIIGPELATYGVVQPIARQLGLDMLGTLHERIGDTLSPENAGTVNGDADYSEGWGQSGWGRVFGEQIDNRYKSYTNPSATGRDLGMQVGLDLWRGSFISGHRDAAGVYFAYGNSAVDVDGLVTNAEATNYVLSHTGTLNLAAYAGGAYWTHYGPGGWYLDAVLQGTAYTGAATTASAKLPTNGTGFISSLEAGYPVPLPLGPNFVLEPQGQIIWQHVGFRDAFDGTERIGLGSTSGTTGRLGLRGRWTIEGADGAVWQPYGRINLWHDWGGQATTDFGFDQVPVEEAATRLEFAAGVTAKISPHLSFYTQAGYQFAIADTDGGRRQGVKGDIGLRYTFGAPRPVVPAAAVVPAPAPVRSYLVFFDWDKATLTDRARQIIREAAEASTHVQLTRIAINGYTDTSGSPRYNQGLSVRRAEAVAAELVRDGVPRSVIIIRGFGETHLLVPTGAGVREPQNRRVEILLQ